MSVRLRGNKSSGELGEDARLALERRSNAKKQKAKNNKKSRTAATQEPEGHDASLRDLL